MTSAPKASPLSNSQSSALSHKLQRRSLLQYSLLAFPLAFVGLPLYLHAPEFYAREIGLSLGTLGVALLALRIIDAVQDPLIGKLSDDWHAHRAAIVLLGMSLLIGGIWILFHPWQSSPLTGFVLGVFLSTTGYSILSINLQALGSLWRCDSVQRTRVTAWREALGLLGLLVAAITPSILNHYFSPAGSFHWLSLMYIPVLVISLIFFWRWYQSTRFLQANRPSTGFAALRTRWSRHFYGILLVNGLAAAIPGVLVLFFIKDRLELPDLVGLFLLLYFISGVLAMPLWQWLAKKHGKAHAWLVSILLSVVTFVWAFTLTTGDAAAYALICILSGLALGADLALPPSILADHIQATEGEEEAARYFSVLNFVTKAALALATGIALPLLAAFGYQPGMLQNYAQTDILSFTYALIPSMLKIIVAYWLWRFIQTELTTRKDKRLTS